MSLNPNVKIAKSKGVDIPLMYVYLVGRISGNCMEKCVAWRKEIIEHYRNYKGKGAYPISFLCPLNSGESKTADALGLKSHLPKNLIYDKDLLSLKTADVVVANMNDFMEDGIEDLMEHEYGDTVEDIGGSYVTAFFRLQDKIKNRRPNLGSHYEVTVAIENKKPTILIAGNENNKYILDNHPFFSRASVVVLNTKQLFEEKWLQVLYKSMSGSIGEY